MYGVPAKVPAPTAYLIIASISRVVYPRFFNAVGTDWLMILKYPPPLSFLNLTRAKSGSTPVVSQSITRPIVPVGAIQETCAFLNPHFWPSSSMRSDSRRVGSAGGGGGWGGGRRGRGGRTGPWPPRWAGRDA